MTDREPHNTPSHSNGRYRGEFPVSERNGYAGQPFTPPQQDDDEIDLKRLFYTLLRYKWIILLALMLGTAGGYFFADSQTPIFRGEGSMIIAQDHNRFFSGGNDLGSMLSSSFGIGQSNRIQNEIEVLRSRIFIGELVDHLLQNPQQSDGTQWPVLYTEYPDDPQLDDRLMIIERIRETMSADIKGRDTDIVQITYESPSREEAQYVVNLILDNYYNFSQRQNRRQARAAIEFLEREEETLNRRLNQSEDQLRDFMNREGLVQLDAQTTALVTTMASLESERKGVEVQFVAVRSAVENYEAELEAIRPGLAEQFAATLWQRLTRYQFQLAEIETEKMLMVSRNPQLRDNPQLEPSYVRMQDEASEMRREIRDITEQVLVQDERFLGFLDQQSGGIAAQLASLRQSLLELRVEQSQLEAQASVLDERIAREERFFERIPDNMVEMARLQRDMKVNEQLFLTVAQQSAELGVWEQTQMGFGQVVDYSVEPRFPVRPRKLLILLIGFMLGGMAGVGYAFLRELSITQINNIDKLKEKKYPILAIIPDIRDYIKKQHQGKPVVRVSGHTVSTDLVTLLDSISPPSEAFRRLQSNLVYSQPDNPYKVICVSSAGKGEGKTTVMSNLAVTLAEAGKKVLIIDCDFRRPRIHREFGLVSTPGVTDYLFDEISLEEAKRETLVDGITVMPAGKKTPNPSGISRSPKLIELIKQVRDQYDYVLVDAAPYGIITDAAPLLTAVDGIVLVVRFNQTREADLDQTIENLQSIRANIIGTVMIAFNHKEARGYYYTSYYYKYAYSSYNEYVEDKE